MGQIEANGFMEPQDTPIPCAVRVGATTFEAGTPFSAVIDKALSSLEVARSLLDDASSALDDTGNTDNAPLLRQIDSFLGGRSVAERDGKLSANKAIELLRAAGICDGAFDYQMFSFDDVLRLLGLAIKDEREECALLCDSISPTASSNAPMLCAIKIRDRSRAAPEASKGQAAIRCPEKLNNGGVCPRHNLQCGWPDCNKEKTAALAKAQGGAA